jgi:hypothetical protein
MLTVLKLTLKLATHRKYVSQFLKNNVYGDVLLKRLEVLFLGKVESGQVYKTAVKLIDRRVNCAKSYNHYC